LEEGAVKYPIKEEGQDFKEGRKKPVLANKAGNEAELEKAL